MHKFKSSIVNYAHYEFSLYLFLSGMESCINYSWAYYLCKYNNNVITIANKLVSYESFKNFNTIEGIIIPLWETIRKLRLKKSWKKFPVSQNAYFQFWISDIG